MVDGVIDRGFLFAEDKDGFTIIGSALPLSLKRILKHGPTGPPNAEITRRVIKLAAAVEEVVADLQGRNDNATRWFRSGATLTKQTAVFVFARSCARAGRKDLADRLDAELLKLDNDSDEFRHSVQQHIAHTLMWSAIEDCGDPKMTRPEMLAQFERILRDIPASSYHAVVGDYAKTLRTMIAQDEAHQRSAQPIETMSVEEKVRELIYRLRDQRSFLEVTNSEGRDTPEGQLFKLGAAAVPTLIETLGDKGFTRYLLPSSNGCAPNSPRTIGDCVRDILWKISARGFSTREDANSWWRDFRAKGEKAVLIEGVRAGREDSHWQAERLAKIDPNACLEASVAGIRAAKDDEVRLELVHAIAGIKSEGATAALRREMLENKSLEGRVAAASELFRRGAKDSVSVVIEEWRKWEPGPEGGQFAHDVEPVIAFLDTCGDIAAIKALAERFPRLGVSVKLQILDATIAGQTIDGLLGVGAELPADVERCAEEIGIAALADKTIIEGMSMGDFSIPRVCDYAAIQFTNRWPERYSFKLAGTDFERDVQIARIENTWRESHGLKPLPSPQRPPDNSPAQKPDGDRPIPPQQ
jgi:hypothetical protein